MFLTGTRHFGYSSRHVMRNMTTYEQELETSFAGVIREADALYNGQGRLRQTYERLAARLAGLNISYSLVGGYALILHRVRRFTEDIDLLVRPHDLEIMRNQLIGKGYAEIQGANRSIRDTATGVRIDFVLTGEFPGDGKPKPMAFPDPDLAVEHASDGVRVIDLKTLIELKLASGMTGKGRLQDLADVQRLIAVHRLDRDFALKLDPYVRDNFLELLEDGTGESFARRRRDAEGECWNRA